MGTVAIPAPSIETFTLKGRGTLVLSAPQVTSRALTMSVEKVISPPPVRAEYFNLRYPEPKGFWGYLQVISRDFVVSTIPLEYRRQVALQWDRAESQQLAQLRCDVIELGEFLANYIQVSGSDSPIELAALELLKQQFAEKRSEFSLLPVALPTAIWYDIEPGCMAQVTTEWVGFVIPCSTAPQTLPAVHPPEKGESGPSQRPEKEVPANRATDPQSDNESPPGAAPVSPTSAPPGPPLSSLQWAAKYLYQPPGFSSPLEGFGYSAPPALATGPNPYSTGAPQGGSGGGTGPTRIGFYRDGVYVGDFVDTFANSITYVKIPI